MGDRPKTVELDWIALLVGVIGGLGGIATSSWFLIASSHRGGGDPVVGFSETELKAYSIAMLLLFFVALVASLLGLKTPRAAGLALVATGGLSIALAVYGIVTWLFGGLLLIPFGFLVLVAGVILITRRRSRDGYPLISRNSLTPLCQLHVLVALQRPSQPSPQRCWLHPLNGYLHGLRGLCDEAGEEDVATALGASCQLPLR